MVRPAIVFLNQSRVFQTLSKIFYLIQAVTVYIGRRARTRDVLQRHMYITEITQWLQEAEQEERQDINHIIEEAHFNARLINA